MIHCLLSIFMYVIYTYLLTSCIAWINCFLSFMNITTMSMFIRQVYNIYMTNAIYLFFIQLKIDVT